jgi:hypothetical protein
MQQCQTTKNEEIDFQTASNCAKQNLFGTRAEQMNQAQIYKAGLGSNKVTAKHESSQARCHFLDRSVLGRNVPSFQELFQPHSYMN